MSSSTIEAIFDRLLSGDSGEDSKDSPESDSDESDGGSNVGSKGIYGLVDKQIEKLANGEPPENVVSLAIQLHA